MSFICDVCDKPTKKSEKMNKVVVKFRPSKYPKRVLKSGNVDHGGEGTEIVKEAKVGPCCFVENK